MNDYNGESLQVPIILNCEQNHEQGLWLVVCQTVCELLLCTWTSWKALIVLLILVINLQPKWALSSNLLSHVWQQFTRLIPLGAKLNKIFTSLCGGWLWSHSACLVVAKIKLLWYYCHFVVVPIPLRLLQYGLVIGTPYLKVLTEITK